MPAAFTDEEMKILVLFALNSAGGFSETETLCNIVAAADANYIDTKTAIASLVSLGLVTDYNDEGEKFTVINDDGRKVVTELKTKIPITVREKVAAEAAVTVAKIRKGICVTADVSEPGQNGFCTVTLDLLDDDGERLMKIELLAPTPMQGDMMAKKFKENPSVIYENIISALTQNRDDVTEYIIEQDEKIADLKHALDRKRNECEELKKQAEDAKAAENKDRLQQEIDNRDGIITVLDDMSQNEIKSRDEKIKELEEKLSAKKENEEDLFASQKENEAKLFTIQKELDELRALLTEKDAEIEKLKGENEKAKNESEEILKAAKIKSDYMVKNAEFFAFSTREKLLSAKKTIDAALSDIDKSISTTKEETEE